MANKPFDISNIEDNDKFSRIMNQLFDDVGSKVDGNIPFTLMKYSSYYIPYINANFRSIGKSLGIELEMIKDANNHALNRKLIDSNFTKIYLKLP